LARGKRTEGGGRRFISEGKKFILLLRGLSEEEVGGIILYAVQKKEGQKKTVNDLPSKEFTSFLETKGGN